VVKVMDGSKCLLIRTPFQLGFQLSKDLSKQIRVALEVTDRRLLGVIEETSRDLLQRPMNLIL
jgi:hypothetical protein